jgi:hypothetical protein
MPGPFTTIVPLTVHPFVDGGGLVVRVLVRVRVRVLVLVLVRVLVLLVLLFRRRVDAPVNDEGAPGGSSFTGERRYAWNWLLANAVLFHR